MAAEQNNRQKTRIYSAGIMSQSFWFVELKKYLKLLSEGYTPGKIKTMVIQGNLFGSPNEYRARRIFGYISNRAAQMDETGLELFFSSNLATQKLLNLVYREKAILGGNTLEKSDANVFFRDKEIQSEVVAGWTDKTKIRIQSAYFNFLTDANLLSIADKQKIITPPLLDIALEQYLEANGETSIIKAITGVY